MTDNNYTPLVSLIVPVYKVERYLSVCIESVKVQTYLNWELILVDDGSPDHCPVICDKYAAEDTRIKVIHQENGGVALARNVALDVATGEYISFLDSDDVLHPDYLTTLVQLIVKYTADIVQCGFVRGKQLCFPELENKNNIKILNNHSVFLKGYARIIVWAKLYKRSVLEGVRMPVGKFFEDDYTTWKWYFQAEKIVVTAAMLYYYRDNVESTMANHSAKPRLDFIDAYDERIFFFQNAGKKDLEDYSRAHLCKSMVLSCINPNLNPEQKKIVKYTFKENWNVIKFSPYVDVNLKILFVIYLLSPAMTRLILNRVYKS